MSEPNPATTWSERAARYPDVLPVDRRKQSGAWFTPMALALPTARRTLAPLLRGDRGERLRICDPAVGGGTFLLAALQVLTDAGGNACTLVGLDSDAEAARLAALALDEALARDEAGCNRADVRQGDGLRELEPESFDCVLTNPPWETLQSGPHAPARVAELRPHFVHQGRGKLYSYRLFVERALQLLRPQGRLGLIVPASLWFDRDAEPLRRLLLDSCDWQWLFGFENRKKVFAIDSRYRFGVVVATKGGSTGRVCVAFGRTRIEEWATRSPTHVAYEREELQALSPNSGAFVEVESRRDLAILQRMHAHGRPLCGAGGVLSWRQGDFNMTADRAQFVLREVAERDGYRHDGAGVWRSPARVDLLPLIQGAMVHDLHPNSGAHQHGIGHKTRWRAPTTVTELRPLFLVAASAWRQQAATREPARIVLRALSNATNERTAIACLLSDLPCGNSLGVLGAASPGERPLRQLAACAALISSLAFDWALRLRLGGTNLNSFVLADCVLPRLDAVTELELAQAALQLCAITPWQQTLWHEAQAEGWCRAPSPALDPEQRRELTTRIDLLAGSTFGLCQSDVTWITRGCGEPPDANHRKGFWRVDRELPASQRRPDRWRRAAEEAQQEGAQK